MLRSSRVAIRRTRASNMSMKLKKIQREEVGCTTSAARPFGCMELWAGTERAHGCLELAGLEAYVIAVPSGGKRGGALSDVFACSGDSPWVVLVDLLWPREGASK